MALSANVVCLLSFTLCFSAAFADDDHGADVLNYDSDSFKEGVESKDNFVMFFAPW